MHMTAGHPESQPEGQSSGPVGLETQLVPVAASGDGITPPATAYRPMINRATTLNHCDIPNLMAWASATFN
jgi:hypothetical protein